MIVALIPAAGKSSRFGTNKLTQRIGSLSVIEYVITALRDGGAARVLVVLSPQNAEILTLIKSIGADVLLLEHATADMRETLQAGLAWLAQHLEPPEAWLMCPADHPAISASVVRDLISAFLSGPSDAVYIPTYLGQRGHPVLLGWAHAEKLLQFSGPGGLNAYLRQQPVTELPVCCPGILYDLDTPQDLERIRELLQSPPDTLPQTHLTH